MEPRYDETYVVIKHWARVIAEHQLPHEEMMATLARLDQLRVQLDQIYKRRNSDHE